MVTQTVAWLGALAWTRVMAPKPIPPQEIKPFPTTIGIEEGRGGARPRPKPEK